MIGTSSPAMRWPLPPGGLIPMGVWVHTEHVLAEELYPDESEYLLRAHPTRREDFATVRACARRALATLGIERPSMVPGPGGAPPWPDGVSGSMTHTKGFWAAAVAPDSVLRSVGIDTEPNVALPAEVVPTIAGASEQAELAQQHDSLPEVAWDRLLFSAKESVYKAWFPLTSSWLGFEDVRISLDREGRFGAELIQPGRTRAQEHIVSSLVGRWSVTPTHLVTAAAFHG